TVTIPVPGRSRRATITRWGDIALLGTTDDDYQGDLDEVYCTADERDFLIDGTRTALNTDLDKDDVLGSIAGTRPLTAAPGGKSVDVKRNHEIRVDADGLVTVVGGKLTTSRHMAEQTVDAVAKVLGSKARCTTTKQPLLGGAGYDPQSTTATGGLVAHLGERYGNESHFVADIVEGEEGAGDPLVEGLPYLTGEAVYSIRREMATTISDILDRRTRSRLHARDASAAAAPKVADLLVTEGTINRATADAQLADYLDGIAKEANALNTYTNEKEYV
ncbi:MAG: FAD-dependent oxidoreductase, partial [Brachybacterium sp.]|nr:FAD-dependent oxidoreductase [Brachybacterium sp.]